jgi:heme-degrading monooxygenase HmoA
MVVVTFRHRKAPGVDEREYAQRLGKLLEIVSAMPGFRAIRSYASEDGEKVSLIEFDSHEAVARWRENATHAIAQELGKRRYYSEYHLQICDLVRESHMEPRA